MNALLIEAGDKWVLPFEKVAKIAEGTAIQPYAFSFDELQGLLPLDGSLVPVWRPREFTRTGPIVVVVQTQEGSAGLHVNQVMGLCRTSTQDYAHGDSVSLDNGEQGLWFAIDEMERRHAVALPEE
jgi:chemotaxis signal transduction protein